MEKVIADLDNIHKQLMDLVTPMAEEKFSKRISEDKWSVAENIHHLYLVEQRYLTDLQAAIKDPKPMSAIRRLFQVPGWMASIRLVKVKAPKIVEPLNAPAKSITLENYNQVRSKLKKLCQDNGQSVFEKIRVKHPFFGDLDGVNAVIFLVGHEARHYKQIIETIN